MGPHFRTAVLVALLTGRLGALPIASEAPYPKRSMRIGLIAYANISSRTGPIIAIISSRADQS
jgi:hypothetical protein